MWLALVLGALVFVNLYVFVWDKKSGVRAIKQQAEATQPGPTMAIPAAPLALDAGVAITPPARATGDLEGKVGKAETLGKLLKKHGLTAAEADEVIRALSATLDFKAIRAGEAFRIRRGSDGRVAMFELDVAKGHRVRAERAPSGELVATATEPARLGQ